MFKAELVTDLNVMNIEGSKQVMDKETCLNKKKVLLLSLVCSWLLIMKRKLEHYFY